MSAQRVPCLECGRPTPLGMLVRCIHGDLVLPYVLCDACRDAQASRYATGGDLTIISRSEARRQQRLITLHHRSRVLPVAKALLADAKAVVS